MITDWLMVGITFVYVVATILICRFNYQSAKASREQVDESMREFEKNRQLQTMPYLQIEMPIDCKSPLFVIDLSQNNERVNTYSFAKLKNVGNGTSVNIIYSWNGNTECFPINAVMQGDSYFFQFTFHISENGYTRHLLEWEYQDLLGNSYTQKVYFNFKDGDLLDYENDTPVFKGKIKYVWDNEC